METASELTAVGLLCDFAQVHAGKLNIVGAGIVGAGAPPQGPPYPISIALAVMITIPWSATNQQHRLTIELMSEPGGGAPAQRVPLMADLAPEQKEEDRGILLALFNAGRSPEMDVGESTLLPLAVPLQGFPVPHIGSYFFTISIDGTPVDTVSFKVKSAPVMLGMQQG